MLTSEEVREITNTFSDDAWEWPMKRRANRKVVQALLADRAEMQAEIERLRAVVDAAEGVKDGHIIEFRDDGWTIQHPLSCRPNLFDCEVNRAAERDVDGVPPEGTGRYTCGSDEGGRFWYDGASHAALVSLEGEA